MFSGNSNKLAVSLVVIVLLLTAAMSGQEAKAEPVKNFYAAGVSYNGNGSPAVAGTGMYARLVSADAGTYAFTIVDATTTNKLKTVNTSFSVGLAQRIATIWKLKVYGNGAAGISYTGTNTGWDYSAGVLVPVKVKKDANWYVSPMARFHKSNVNGEGYTPILGVLFGWGK